MTTNNVSSEVFLLEPGTHVVSLKGDAKRSYGGTVALVLLDGTNRPAGLLRQVGERCTYALTEPTQLLVSAVGFGTDFGADLEVAIEWLGDGMAPPAPADTPPSWAAVQAPADMSTAQVNIVAHVALQGDVAFRSGEWIGGPTAPARIEGVLIDWPSRPADVALSYCTAMANGARGDWMGPGAFSGTRGKSLALTSIGLNLSGPGAAGWRLSVEAVFQDAQRNLTQRAEQGAAVMLAGRTGREQLVGLRIAVLRADADAVVARASVVPGSPRGTARQGAGLSRINLSNSGAPGHQQVVGRGPPMLPAVTAAAQPSLAASISRPPATSQAPRLQRVKMVRSPIDR